MAPITESMIRTRAEHNEGIVSTLKEVSLHQQDIEKIEVLGQLCPHLEILYLQNNLISKLQNLYRLKELKYLNLAVNNITRIEGLERCESLTKLDLTLNFIDTPGILTLERLTQNLYLQDLYLTGNPCTDVQDYRKYTVATLRSLKRLDGAEVPHSERIAADQVLKEVRGRIMKEVTAQGHDAQLLCSIMRQKNTDPDYVPEEGEEEEAVSYNEKGEELRRYSAAVRLKEHRELAAMKEAADKQKQASTSAAVEGSDKPRHRKGFDILEPGQRIYQKNEGKWDFTLKESEDGQAVVLDVAFGRYLDTSLIDVDVQPSCVRVLSKGKLLQLLLPAEVFASQTSAQRSLTTGHLVLTMPKVHPSTPPPPPPTTRKKEVGKHQMGLHQSRTTTATEGEGGKERGGGKGSEGGCNVLTRKDHNQPSVDSHTLMYDNCEPYDEDDVPPLM